MGPHEKWFHRGKDQLLLGTQTTDTPRGWRFIRKSFGVGVAAKN